MELTFSKRGGAAFRNDPAVPGTGGEWWMTRAIASPKQASLVSPAPVGKAYFGALNNAEGRTMAGHDVWRFS
jgi:hypothetical protein